MGSTIRLIVIGPATGPAAERLREQLACSSRTPEAWILPRDADELGDRLEDGGEIEVLFPSFGDFLAVLWSGQVPTAVWRHVHVRCTDIGAGRDADADAPRVAQTLDAWESFMAATRRRRQVAATVLSLLAIGAAASLTWLV